MTKKRLLLGILGLIGTFMILFVFLNESSPYVTVTEARKLKSDGLHLAGEIVLGSVSHLIKEKKMVFDLVDQKGEKITVKYSGMPPANFSEIKKVVAIGHIDDDHFSAERLLIKCPSKYESQ